MILYVISYQLLRYNSQKIRELTYAGWAKKSKPASCQKLTNFLIAADETRMASAY